MQGLLVGVPRAVVEPAHPPIVLERGPEFLDSEFQPRGGADPGEPLFVGLGSQGADLAPQCFVFSYPANEL